MTDPSILTGWAEAAGRPAAGTPVPAAITGVAPDAGRIRYYRLLADLAP